jgi:WD40 repeat protein
MLAGTAVSTYFALNAAEEAARAEANARTAEGNERAANKQSLLAKTEGERARQNELVALGNLYVSRMSQASLSWEAGNAGRVRELLDATEPQRTGGQDFRGFEWHYLRRLLDSEQRSLRGPWTMVDKLSLAFRGRTSQLALAGQGFPGQPEALVWDAATGKQVRSLSGATAVAFSADGKLLATLEPAMLPAGVVVRDADTGKELASLAGDTAAAFSADGKLVAAIVRGQGVLEDDLRVWDWATRKVVGTFAGYGTRFIQSVAFSPDGKFLAAGGYAYPSAGLSLLAAGRERLPVGKVWDVATGKELWVITHPGGVSALAFAPDGRRLATAGADHVARVWDAPTGKELLTLVGHGGIVSGVAFSPDGKLLATSGHDQTVRMWSAEDGRPLRVYRGHTFPVLSVGFSADGRLLAAAAADGTVKLWDAARDQEATALALGNEIVFALAFDPRGKGLAVGGQGLRV